MNDDRLTPEERAVIEAALTWADVKETMTWTIEASRLARTVDAYRKATAPPEPFEAYVGFGGHELPEWAVYPDPDILDACRGSVWRCTVTPTERVR